MELYEIQTDHILVNQDDTISLNNGEVIGISIEVLSTSGTDLKYGLNESPKIDLTVAGTRSRAYGGFSLNGNPGVYRGNLQIKFASNTNPQALVILTRFVPTPICV